MKKASRSHFSSPPRFYALPFEQPLEEVGAPARAVGGTEKVLQAVRRRTLSGHGREADDAVRVGVGVERGGFFREGAGRFGELHRLVPLGRPAVADEAGDGDVERRGEGAAGVLGVGGVAVEEPLRGIVRLRLRQAVRVFFLCHLLPTLQVEGDFDESSISDLQRFIERANGLVEFGRGAEGPDCWKVCLFIREYNGSVIIEPCAGM